MLEDLAEKGSNLEVRRVAAISMIMLGEVKGFQHFIDSFHGRGDSAVREMDYVELTELSNLYVPVGFRIDDYLQDIPIGDNPNAGGTKN